MRKHFLREKKLCENFLIYGTWLYVGQLGSVTYSLIGMCSNQITHTNVPGT